LLSSGTTSEDTVSRAMDAGVSESQEEKKEKNEQAEESVSERFRVVVINALPNEVFSSHYGFSRLTETLNEESRSGWIPKQISTSWAQGYMIFTVILEREVVEDVKRSASTNSDIEIRDISGQGSFPVKRNFSASGYNLLGFVATTVGMLCGIGLLFFGLVRALAVSNAIEAGSSLYGGFLLPAILVIFGLGLIVFCSYEMGFHVRSEKEQ
jgi:hypothetical protein